MLITQGKSDVVTVLIASITNSSDASSFATKAVRSADPDLQTETIADIDKALIAGKRLIEASFLKRASHVAATTKYRKAPRRR